MKRNIKIIIILIILTILYLYVANISLMPRSITLLQGEKLKLATLWGINLKQKNSSNPNITTDTSDQILETSGDLGQSEITNVRQIRYECKFI